MKHRLHGMMMAGAKDGAKKALAKSRRGGRKMKRGKGRAKMAKVMHEFKAGALRSGSKKGPKVTNRKQAIAIGMSEQRKANRGGY